MKENHFIFRASDGKDINVYRCLPEGQAKALILICHGLTEHAARYLDFARELTAAGYIVYAPDQRGHGRTAANPDELGFIADEDGFNRLVLDIYELFSQAQAEHPGLCNFIMGHSFGCFVAQAFIQKYGSMVQACILSGVARETPRALILLGKTLSALGMLFRGKKGRAYLLSYLNFGPLQKKYRHEGYRGAWLSRDREHIRQFEEDPLAGFICTFAFYRDLFAGISELYAPAALKKIPTSLSMYFFAGADDQLGAAHGGVDALVQKYQQLGLRRIDMKLYEGGRHEMLQEINRAEVYQDVIAWLDTVYAEK